LELSFTFFLSSNRYESTASDSSRGAVLRAPGAVTPHRKKGTDTMIAKKDYSNPRPFHVVVEELCLNHPWNLNAHYEGCYACYQAYGPHLCAAVHLAFDAIEGAVYDAELQASASGVTTGTEWKVDPRALVAVPYFFLLALAECWRIYKTDGGSLGHVFALEGGQGKPPMTQVMDQLRDARAIARWIGDRITRLRADGVKGPVTSAMQAAVEKFNLSEVTILRYWNKFRRLEIDRLKKGS
jgi:hypothetical protein